MKPKKAVANLFCIALFATSFLWVTGCLGVNEETPNVDKASESESHAPSSDGKPEHLELPYHDKLVLRFNSGTAGLEPGDKLIVEDLRSTFKIVVDLNKKNEYSVPLDGEGRLLTMTVVRPSLATQSPSLNHNDFLFETRFPLFCSYGTAEQKTYFVWNTEWFPDGAKVDIGDENFLAPQNDDFAFQIVVVNLAAIATKKAIEEITDPQLSTPYPHYLFLQISTNALETFQVEEADTVDVFWVSDFLDAIVAGVSENGTLLDHIDFKELAFKLDYEIYSLETSVFNDRVRLPIFSSSFSSNEPFGEETPYQVQYMDKIFKAVLNFEKSSITKGHFMK